METERASPRYSDIDVWAPSDILDAMIEGQFTAVAAVRAARPAIEAASLAIEERLRNGGRPTYAGAAARGGARQKKGRAAHGGPPDLRRRRDFRPSGRAGRRGADADLQLAAG